MKKYVHMLRQSSWSRALRLSSWSVAIGSIAFLLAACGDEVTTQVIQDNMSIVSTTKELPKCTKDNEGEQAFVKGETAPRVCMDGKWFATSSGDKDTVLVKDTIVIEKNSTCTTKELKDKSGIKIICGGDSVGVVLNGQNGANGKDGSNGKDGTNGKDGSNGKNGVSCSVENKTDSTVTIACGTDKFTIPLGNSTKPDTGDVEYEIENGSISGVSQKGPFVKGSSVTAVELDGSKSLLQTGRSFVSVITQDDGRFNMRNVTLKSSYVRLSVNGYYRNEVTGKNSTSQITLNAVTDLNARNTVNVNLLTHLEYERVAYLMVHGDGTLKIKKLKKQAEGEIFKAFHFDDLADFGYSEDLDVFGKTDADAALLAISILLQGDRDEADLVVLLTEMSNAFAEKGEWMDSSARAQIALWAAVADGQGRLNTFANHVKSWGLGDGTVPPFEKYVRNFYGKETGLGLCGGKDNSSGVKKTLKVGSDTFNFVCEDAEKGWWRLLTKLDLDTAGWGTDFKEGDVRNGQVNKNLTYVFENGAWRYGTSLDSTLGLSCIPARKDTLLKASVVDYYKCVGDTVVSFEGLIWSSVWRKATNDELDMDYWERNKNENGLLLKTPFTGRTMVWDADTLREPILVEQEWNKACVSYMYADKEDGYAVDTLSNGLGYKCSDTGWSRLGTFRDDRDGTIYKGVKIGKQTWMAENLNYSGKYTYGGLCYGNVESNCAKYGRLYTWPAAMDSAGYWSTNGVGCTCYDKVCSPSYPVRGICPKGWHLPDINEWEDLVKEVGGRTMVEKNLKSQVSWEDKADGSSGNGLDTYAFSAIATGFRDNTGEYCDEGVWASFWSSSESDENDAQYLRLDNSDDNYLLTSHYKEEAFSIRCIRN